VCYIFRAEEWTQMRQNEDLNSYTLANDTSDLVGYKVHMKVTAILSAMM
jgi:hypothetical protein